MLHEIIFLGRGGQGAVTAANILVQAAIYENKYGQGSPFFGAERRGAPVAAYARVSDKPILRRGIVSRADAIVVLDHKLIDIGVLKRYIIKPGGALIVNTPQGKSISRELINAEGRVAVYTVNATRIAEELKLIVAGWPVVNTSMLGALARVLPAVSIDSVVRAVKEYFGGRVGELNSEAAARAYKEATFIGEV